MTNWAMSLGTPARGSAFWGREQDLAAIWGYLEQEHLIFPGVRRLGKSSILCRLQEQAASKGLLAKVIDLSGVTSAQAFVERLNQEFAATGISAFVKKNAQTVTVALARLDSVQISLPEAAGGGGVEAKFKDKAPALWHEAARALQQRLQGQPLLILLDEFPVMLQRLLKDKPQEAEQLLLWLRSWRQINGNECRFVFTGSIGLQSLLERHGMAVHMNDCYGYELGPFSRQEATEMWQHFAPQHGQGLQTSTEVIEHALNRIGWLAPFYVCLMIDAATQAAKIRIKESAASAQATNHRDITLQDINTAYEMLLAKSGRFTHWEQRLRQALPKAEFAFAQALLTHVAKSKTDLSLKQLSNRLMKQTNDARQRAQQIQSTLAYLSDEGYTTPPNAEGRVQFRSFLLRDWWSRNHV